LHLPHPPPPPVPKQAFSGQISKDDANGFSSTSDIFSMGVPIKKESANKHKDVTGGNGGVATNDLEKSVFFFQCSCSVNNLVTQLFYKDNTPVVGYSTS